MTAGSPAHALLDAASQTAGVSLTLSLAVDVVVVGLLLGLAARIMWTRDLFEAVVLFIAFGLTLALAWVRLGAADVALAEAALGAGVTGALFLNAYKRLGERAQEELQVEARPLSVGKTGWARWGPGLAVAGGGVFFAVLAALLVWALPERAPLLPGLVAERLDETGVSNPVTGVLLGFRAYDTLLEMGVLVVAMVGVWSLDRGSRDFARDPAELQEDPVLHGLVRVVVPVAGLTAIYLVWAGSHSTGGAFQAGALLAGVGVLLAAAGLIRPVTSAAPAVRVLGVMALVLFTAVGLGTMPWTGTFLAYPPGTEYGLILLVEAALTVSIAVILLELFVDVPAVPEPDPDLARVHPTGDPLGRTLSPDGAWIRGAGEDE